MEFKFPDFSKFFDKLDEAVNSTEGSIVNFLTAFAPWLAPLAPAFMMFNHMIEFLEFPWPLALVLAILVEIMGFGTVSTGLDFWFYNRRERSGVKKAPLGVVIGSFIFYLLLILGSNVAIDLAHAYGNENWQKAAVIVVRTLLTLQTIPGALIVAVRTGHRSLLREIKAEKLERNLPKVTETSTKDPSGEKEKLPKDWRKVRPMLTEESLMEISQWTAEQIRQVSQEQGIEERTLINWRTRARLELENGQNDAPQA
jgi:hypothetical protein